jgi:hypothetical protein
MMGWILTVILTDGQSPSLDVHSHLCRVFWGPPEQCDQSRTVKKVRAYGMLNEWHAIDGA